MKKFFSLIALAALLVGCEPEKIETAFSAGHASLEIHVTALDLSMGEQVIIDGSDYVLRVYAPAGYPAVNVDEDVVSAQGEDGAALPEGTFVIALTAGGDEEYGRTEVFVPRILAGTNFITAATIIFGEIPGDIEIIVTRGRTATSLEIDYIDPVEEGDIELYGHKYWNTNLTDEPVNVSYTFKSKFGNKVESLVLAGTEYDDIANAYVEAYTGISEDTHFEDLLVPRYSIYSIWLETYTSRTPVSISVVRDGITTDIATYQLVNVSSHDNHWVENYGDPRDHGFDHGSGHGDSGNAGGGVAYN